VSLVTRSRSSRMFVLITYFAFFGFYCNESYQFVYLRSVSVNTLRVLWHSSSAGQHLSCAAGFCANVMLVLQPAVTASFS
jgi:hypothetical protein